MVINCSAYPATLLESELFGHEKGAFTGALRQKAGRFEQAHGGTVFLDEIGEIPPPAQIKLLRVLQTRKFERLGGEQTLTVDVRILAATHKDLLEEVKKGNFREDLFYRLNVIPIILPPLRDRKNDIPRLALHFLRRFAAEQGKEILEFSSEAMRLLLDYSWPGNVRELENTVEHAVVLAKGSQVEAWDFPWPCGLRSDRPKPWTRSCRLSWRSWKNAAGTRKWRPSVWGSAAAPYTPCSKSIISPGLILPPIKSVKNSGATCRCIFVSGPLGLVYNFYTHLSI